MELVVGRIDLDFLSGKEIAYGRERNGKHHGIAYRQLCTRYLGLVLWR